ncbi:hypothetical protein [Sphingomonas sp. CFBP 8760]|uniref:hypothetical protein n=1 Tax=Sphingomonas sp. CFBP 8760 TaxID=2775282 RepID=UPI0017853D58|nr:hypothetical protein [Sphingomonas sp. CFBP 8760]MBD8547903.1 hypothetical protein [Sphingomonas sp. CFBP 8760]
MAILAKLLGTASENYIDVVDTLNNALDTIKTLTADVAALKKGTATPSPSPSPTPSPTPTPSGTVVYPGTGQSGTTGDTGFVEVGSQNQRMQFPYKNGVSAGIFMLGMSPEGEGVALVQQNDNNYHVRPVVGFSVGDPLDGNRLQNSSINLNIPDGASFAIDLNEGVLTFLVDGAQVNFVGNTTGRFPAGQYIKGTGARYKKHAGGSIANLQIIAK